MKQQLERAKSRLKNMNQKAADGVMAAVETVETVGVAGAFGYARGRFGDEDGELEVLGAPPELLAGGVAMLGAIVMGMNASTADAARHARAMGDGALSAYAFLKASEIGLDQKNRTEAAGRARRMRASGQRGQMGAAGVNMAGMPVNTVGETVG